MPSFKKILIVEQFQGNYVNSTNCPQEMWTKLNNYWYEASLVIKNLVMFKQIFSENKLNHCNLST